MKTESNAALQKPMPGTEEPLTFYNVVEIIFEENVI